MDTSAPAPGLHPELSNAAYHSSKGISKSHLDDIAPPNSPLHYWERHVNPDYERPDPTPALILGDAIHKAILEPDLLAKNFAVWDGPSRSTKEGKAAWAEFAPRSVGKTVLKKDDYEIVIACRDAAHRHPVARGLLKGGRAEQSYYSIDPQTGALIKCRLDYDLIEQGGLMVDVKSTEDASPEGFGKHAANFRYHVQGAWYPHVVAQLGIDVANFVFIAIEKTKPNAIGVYFLEPEDAKMGMIEARRDLDAILDYRQRKYWPDYAEQPSPLKLPSWKRQQFARLSSGP